MTKKIVALTFVALGLAACAEQDAMMKNGDAMMADSMMSEGDAMMSDDDAMMSDTMMADK